MGFYSRIDNAFKNAPILNLCSSSRYVLISDCHRGIGTWSDNFLKNRHLYFAALEYYYNKGFTYIELGDGDELWENRKMEQIMEIHDNVFRLLSLFLRENRLYMIYGNHDMIKRDNREDFCNSIMFHEGIILKNCLENNTAFSPLSIYLTHGHQADLFNSTLWRASRFLVRYLWTPLERFGVLDPTSAAKNNTLKKKTEKRLACWAEKEGRILMTGHTHRPMMGTPDSPYFNTGSCVHPGGITCIEITGANIYLVKWSMAVKKDYSLYVSRVILEGGDLRDYRNM